jgi:hypothetical protein
MNTKVHCIRLAGLVFLAGALPLGAQQSKPPAPAAPPQASATSAAPASTIPAAPVPQHSPDKVVLKVGDRQVTAGEMDYLLGSLPPQVQRMVATQGPRSVGEQFALMVALSQKAVADHLNQDPEYTRRVQLQQQQMLAQAEYKKLGADIKVTPEEISQYFAAHKADFDEVEVRQVTVRKKAEGSTAGGPGLPPAEARAKAEEIRKALLAGEDPAKLADTYKAPPGAVYIETAPRTVRKGSLQGDSADKIASLKDGEISEVLENPQSFNFTQMVKHEDAQEASASEEIENKLKEQKLQAAVDGVKSSSNIWLDPDFFAAPPAPAPGAQPPAAAPPAKPVAIKPPAAPPSN